MRRPHLLSVLVLFAVMVAGCARQPYPTGYLEDYDGLVNQPDPMRSVFAEQTAAGKQPRVDQILQVLPPTWNAQRLSKPGQEEELLDFLYERMMVYIFRGAPSASVLLVTRSRDMELYVERGVTVVQLQTSITDIKKGAGILRFLFSGFYVAPTHLQVEGKLVELKSQKVLARFARRAVSDGQAFGLRTPQSFSPRFCWRVSINETAQLMARYVLSQMKVPPAAGSEKREVGGGRREVGSGNEMPR